MQSIRSGCGACCGCSDWKRSIPSRGPARRRQAIGSTRTFCVAALERALAQAQPGIFNTDQGSQFTSQEFTSRLLAAEVRISMDGRGRALDNVFVERLWRTVKYEEVYLKSYATVPAAIQSLGEYFRFYNEERLHQALGYLTPAAVYQRRV